jgi:predicted HTH transcriptional regulator
MGTSSAKNGMVKNIAEAACGFTNATGGVIVIGMKAKAGSDGIDVVQQERPVDDAKAVRSQVEDAIATLIETWDRGGSVEIHYSSQIKDGLCGRAGSRI